MPPTSREGRQQAQRPADHGRPSPHMTRQALRAARHTDDPETLVDRTIHEIARRRAWETFLGTDGPARPRAERFEPTNGTH